MKLFKNRLSLLLLSTFAVCLHATAEESIRKVNPDFWNRQNVERISPLLDPFGEKYDTNSGTVSFEYVDANIPGNFPIEVAVHRKISTTDSVSTNTGEFGNFSLDLPRIERNIYTVESQVEPWGGKMASDPQKECTNALMANFTYDPGEAHLTGIASYQYWNGVTLIIPGETQQKLIRKQTGELTTSDNHKFECITRDGGEGFKVTTPQGVSYTFDVRRTTRDVFSSQSIGKILVTQLLVSHVEDKFGNYVNYNYSDEQLSSIVSSDGRQISFTWKGLSFTTYNQTHTHYYIDKITQNTGSQARTWQYIYGNLGTQENGERIYLKNVILPDQKKWTYPEFRNLYAFTMGDGPSKTPGRCEKWSAQEDSKPVIIIKDPHGNIVNFEFEATYHGRTNTPIHQLFTQPAIGPGYSYFVTANCSVSMALVKKKVESVDTADKVWTYKYSQNYGDYEDGGAYVALPYQVDYAGEDVPSNILNKTDFKTTIITKPNGSREIHYINRDFTSALEGTTFAIDKFDIDGTTLLQREEIDYVADIRLGRSGNRESYTNHKPIDYRIDLSRKTLINYHENETTKYYREFSNYNAYGVSTQYTSYLKDNSANIVRTKTIVKGFQHDTNNWHINLPTTHKIISAPLSYQEISYKTLTATNNNKSYSVQVPDKVYAFGMWKKQYLEYHDDGNVKKVEFNEKLKKVSGATSTVYSFQQFDNYKRGQYQLLTVPARYSETATLTANNVVDDNGWITSSTDFKGNVTGYGYDEVGRIAYIDSPNDSNNWKDVFFEWIENSGQAPIRKSYKCLLNSSKTSCQANSTASITETKLDNLWRPTLLTKTDVANNIDYYQIKRFNDNNKEIFSSHWLTSPAEINPAETDGISFTYDGLERLTSISESNGGTQFIDYLSDNKKQVKDALGNITTTTFLAYGSPNYEQATFIDSPENVNTSINFNIYDNISSITQSGSHKNSTISQTEYRAYDSQQRLCQIKRNDVGTTVFNHNDIGEIIWQAQGQVATSNTVCNTTASASDKVTFSYDNLGDQHSISYGDGTTARVFTLDTNGNVKDITGEGFSQSYNYNSLNLLEDESLSIDGKVLTLDYDYTALGGLSTITYPGGLTPVNFGTNAFGQATQAIRIYEDSSTDVFVKGSTKKARYYPNGMIKSFTYGNNIKHSTYLNDRQLPKSVSDLLPSICIGWPTCRKITPKDIINFSYTYDNNNNVTSIVNSRDGGIYTINSLEYDGLGRLIRTWGNSGIGNTSLSYDGLDNIRSYSNTSVFDSHNLTYSYSTINRLSGVSGTGSTGYNFSRTDSYDTRGNVTHNGKHSFNYNSANQMTLSDKKTNNEKSYLYDGYNRRIKSTKANSDVEYSMYSQAGKLLYRETDQGGINYIFLGNKLVAKEGTGVVSQGDSIMNYKPFGDSIEAPKDDIGYTGHKFDTDLGLSYMQARYYDPVIGRFYSNDPVGFSNIHNFNRYAYANNNPYKYTDPDGEHPLAILGAIVGSVTSVTTTLIKTGGNASMKELVGSAVGGAVAGAVAGFTGGASLLTAAATGGARSVLVGAASTGVAGAAGDAIGQGVAAGGDLSKIDGTEVLISGAMSSTGGAMSATAKIMGASTKVATVAGAVQEVAQTAVTKPAIDAAKQSSNTTARFDARHPEIRSCTSTSCK